MKVASSRLVTFLRLTVFTYLVSLIVAFGPSPSFADDGLQIQLNQIDSSSFPTADVTISVVNSAGVPVLGLALQDFQAFDNDKPLQIISVSRAVDAGIGIAVVLAVDTSGSMGGVPLATAKKVARDFVARLPEGDKMAVLAFSDAVTVAQGFTSDKSALARAIDGLQAQGNTALYDATVAAVRLGGQADLPRRAVILLTDGADYGGRSSITRGASLDAASRGGVPIFTVGLGPDPDKAYLSQLSASTQGQAFGAAGPIELAPLYESIQALLRAQYILKVDFGQLAPPGEHTLRVAVAARGATGVGQRTFNAMRQGYRPPQVSLANFKPGGTVDAPMVLYPEMGGSERVAAVRYLWDGAVVAQHSAPPYHYALDPMSLAPGAHSLRIEATDVLGITEGLEVPVIVAAVAPRIKLMGPEGELRPETAAAITLSERTRLEALVASQRPVQAVAFYVNGQLVQQFSSPPYIFDLVPSDYRGNTELDLAVVVKDTATREGRVAIRLQLPAAQAGPPPPVSSAPRRVFPLQWLVIPLVALGGIAVLAFAGRYRRRRGRAAAQLPPLPAQPILNAAVDSESAVSSRPLDALARLTITHNDDPSRLQVVSLWREPVTIGSGQGCGLILRGDGIGSKEVRIWHREGKFMLHNVSRNGATSVGGRQLYWAVLESGDVISIGSYSLRFEQTG